MTSRTPIRLLFTALAFAIVNSEIHQSQTQRSQAASTASIEGTLVRFGTNEPISGADIELTRLEGTVAAPLPNGAAEAFGRLMDNPYSVGAVPPAALAPEVRFTKSDENGRFRFNDLKPGGYRLAAVM